eukprot:s1803_g9.t1
MQIFRIDGTVHGGPRRDYTTFGREETKGLLYNSTCAPVACPSHSTGTDVATGCSCDAGYSGSITASSTSPFYTGSCDAASLISPTFTSSFAR